METEIRILLVDRNEIVRRGLCIQINCLENMSVVAEADGGEEAVQLATTLDPDIVILETEIEDKGCRETIRRIISGNRTTKIVAMSFSSRLGDVTQTLNAGAVGYVWKQRAICEIQNAIEAALEGKLFVSDSVEGLKINDPID